MSTLSGGPNIITDGLVLYLDAGNTYSYTSGSTVWNDLSRSQTSGSLINGPTFTGSNGGAIVFDGTNDYVTGSLSTLNNFTTTYFVYSTDISSTLIFYPLGLQFSGSSSGGGVWFGGTFSQYANKTGLYDGNTEVISSTNIQANIWTSVSITKESTTASVYINGILSKTGSISSSPITRYTIGTRVDGVWPYKGNISQVSIYNRALTASEVLQNYNATKGRFGL
jgi:hypothetical protein